MKLKSYIFSLILVLVTLSLFVLSSCTKAPPESADQELIDYTWIFPDDTGKTIGTLSFNNNNIIINTELSDGKFNFNEECLIDSERITINSKSFGVVGINYKISGDELTLEYMGKSISLKKQG